MTSGCYVSVAIGVSPSSVLASILTIRRYLFAMCMVRPEAINSKLSFFYLAAAAYRKLGEQLHIHNVIRPGSEVLYPVCIGFV